MEIWLPSPIRPDLYIISNYGNIKNIKSNLLLGNRVDSHGYRHISIRIGDKYKNIKLHRLVAMLFIDNPENKPCVNHKDGVKLNNHYSNLEWCTKRENNQHARETGLTVSLKGEDTWNAKFTNEQISEIRLLRNNGKTNKEIALLFNTYSDKISHICRNHAYELDETTACAKLIKLGGRKLSDEDVRQIRILLLKKRIVDIANIYSVTETTISNIKKGKTWKHIK
jgi:HNH endonuclease